MAAKALHRDVPGMAAAGALVKSGLKREMKIKEEKYGWDEIGEYKATESWRGRGLENGDGDVERMRRLESCGNRGEGIDRGSWYTADKTK
jgi:dynactin-4